jgi:ATP synthase F1 delta subunit
MRSSSIDWPRILLEARSRRPDRAAPTHMAELFTIARPYARAAFESAQAIGRLSEWSAALARAAAVVSDERVLALIGNPRVQESELTQMIFELASGAAAPSTDAPAAAISSSGTAKAASAGTTGSVKARGGSPTGRKAPAAQTVAMERAPSLVAATSTQAVRSREELRNFLQLLAQNRRLRLLPEIAAQFENLRADAENFATVEVRSARELTSEQGQRLQRALERRLRRTVRLHTRIDPALIGGAVVQYGDFVVDGSLRRALERMGSEISGP